MKDRQSKHYFLGGNTADGFKSLYDSLVSYEKGDFLWVIKGGAGCGKSGFMRMIGAAAERKGLEVEYIPCSGDPDSLDGVYIPNLKTAYMDGTAPHIADAKLTAVNSTYLDLGSFYDLDGVAEHKQELEELDKEIKKQYEKAYALIAGAGALRRGWLGSLAKPSELESAAKRVDGIIKRELGTRYRGGGEITRRFLSAITCLGLFSLPDTALALCDRFYTLESRIGLSAAMLERIAQSAYSCGFEVFLCPDPLTPELPEAVLVPAVNLGFISSDSALSAVPESRRIHLDSKGETATQRKKRSELARYEKTVAALKGEAVTALAQAKALHDELERVYNPYVDFEGVRTLAGEHLGRLGLS
jgi:hypothetical protein